MAIERDMLKVKVTLNTDMLGTAPKDKEVYAAFVASKTADNQELTASQKKELTETELADVQNGEAEQAETRGWTGFLKDKEKGLWIPDYMIKGFLKTAIETCQVNGAIRKIPAYKKWVDRMIHVRPRKIFLGKMEPDGINERPLRAQTPKGERVTLARSDYIAAGSEFSFEVMILKNTKGLTPEVIEAVFEYGEFVGLGQWRGSGGFGQFTAEVS